MHWVPTGKTVNKEYYLELLREFRKKFLGKRPALFKSAQWHFRQDNAPVHNSILVTDYLTKMGIKTVPQPLYSPDLAPCDFCLFPKLIMRHLRRWKRLWRRSIDMLTQEDFHGAFQKLLERYNKCIAAGGDYFEGDKSLMCVLSIKVPIRRKSGNLLKALRNFCPFPAGVSIPRGFHNTILTLCFGHVGEIDKYSFTMFFVWFSKIRSSYYKTDSFRLVGWFYDMLTLAGLFNAEVSLRIIIFNYIRHKKLILSQSKMGPK